GERRAEEGERALRGGLDADDPGAEREDVHVVVLDALVRAVGVVADRGPDPAHLVGGDRRPHARPADEDPSVRATPLDRESNPLGEVRVVVVWVGPVTAEVDELVLATGEPGELGDELV